jgi:hypothetical protein
MEDIKEISLDTLFQWILESDDVDEIHELVNDYMEGAIPIYD